MRRPAVALLVLLLASTLTAPGAAAFRTQQADIDVVYDLASPPLMIGLGDIAATAHLTDFTIVGGNNGTRLEVPSLQIVAGSSTDESFDGYAFDDEPYRDVTVVIHSGSLVLTNEGAAADLTLGPAYGLALTLPAGDGGSGSAIAFVAPAFAGDVKWAGDDIAIFPGNAVVSILAGDGTPVRDSDGVAWDRRHVNEGEQGSADGGGSGTMFVTTGRVTGALRVSVVAGQLSDEARAAVQIRAAEVPDFDATVDAFATLQSASGGDPSGAEQLRALGAFADVLNGALLLMPPPGSEEAVKPITATYAGEPLPDSNFVFVRTSDVLAVAWSAGQMHASGPATYAVSSAGFTVKDPANLFGIPVVSLVLWAIAIAALVVGFVRKPPKADTPLGWRAGAIALHLVALFAVLLIWDVAFAETFGTSVFTQLREGGFGGDNLARAGLIVGLEFAPWSLAILAFGLPVTLAVGVGLRYLGKGKGLRGVARATGMLSVAVFGTIYALFLVNLFIGSAVAAMAGL